MKKFSMLGDNTPGNHTYTRPCGTFDNLTTALSAGCEDENANRCALLGIWDDEQAEPDWDNGDDIFIIDLEELSDTGFTTELLAQLTPEECHALLWHLTKNRETMDEIHAKRKAWQENLKEEEEFKKFAKLMAMWEGKKNGQK